MVSLGMIRGKGRRGDANGSAQGRRVAVFPGRMLEAPLTKVNALRPRTLGFAAGVSNRAWVDGSRHCQRDRRSARCQLGFRPSRRTPLSLRQRTTASEWRMSSSWQHPLLCWPAPLLGGRVIIQPRTVGSTWTIAAYGSTRSRSRISSIASSDTRLCGSHRWPGRSARWACG